MVACCWCLFMFMFVGYLSVMRVVFVQGVSDCYFGLFVWF